MQTGLPSSEQESDAPATARLEHTTIEFAMLCDRAEVVKGKLYMLGGGWDALPTNSPGQPASFSVAIGLLIPWHETNTPQSLTLHFENADAQKISPDLVATVMAGRPPNAIQGQSFRTMIAINAQVQLPTLGPYIAVARLGGGQERRIGFYAVPPVSPQPMPV